MRLNTTVTALIAAALMLIAAQSAKAQTGSLERGQWYVSPMAGIVFDDEQRLSDPGPGAHLGFGRRIWDSWAIELSLFGMNLTGFNDVDQWGVGVDLLGLAFPDKRLTPYFVIGTGYAKTQNKAGIPASNIQDYDDAIASIGGGLLATLGSSSVMFRADARLRTDFADPGTLHDIVVNLGLLFPIGSSGPTDMLPDSDRDGVPDARDLCPGTPAGAAVDAYGCEFDSDRDTVIDRFDKCPNTPAGTPVGPDGCPRPVDSDGDGVPDGSDKCPGTPAGTPVGPDGCERDTDGDGVPDSRDECPNTPRGVRVDFRGCEIRDEIQLPGVNFELDSAVLTGGSPAVLDGAVSTLQRYPDINVECSGHTDSTGSDAYNERLSQRRAETVCEYLIAKGISGGRLQAKGYGESRPVADNSTAEGRKANRRVTLRITN